MEYIQILPSRKVYTKDANGEPNGYIQVLAQVGRYTTAYVSVFYPRTFRGYHVHSQRTNHIYCLEGEVVIHTKNPISGAIDITPLSAKSEDQVVIAPQIPTAIENIGLTNATLLFVPDPAYDPLDTGEQLHVEREQVEKPEYIAVTEEEDPN